MTLQSSGPISLSQIQTEFGGSNPISLGEYFAAGTYVIDGTIGNSAYIPSSGNSISLSNFYNAAKSQYGVFNGSSSNDRFAAIKYSSFDDTFVAVGRTNAGDQEPNGLIVKIDKHFAVIWQRTLSYSETLVFSGVDIDQTTGDIYVAAGYTNGGTFNSPLLVKYNSSGTLQWQRTNGAGSLGGLNSVKFVSSSAIHFCGETNVTGNGSDFSVITVNSSGTHQWSREYDFNSWWGGCAGIDTDSSGNIYIAGFNAKNTTLDFTGRLVKLNSTGTLQWQRMLGNTNTGSVIFRDVAVTSSGTCYVVGSSSVSSSGDADALIAKYNSSGTLQWQRQLGGANIEDSMTIKLDSSENLYVCFFSESTSSRDLITAKYNSSGTLQWQKSIGTNLADSHFSGGLELTSDGFMYVASFINDGSGETAYLMKFPSLLGCRVGTFGNSPFSITCAISTLTDKTSTSTAAAGNFTQYTTAVTLSNFTATSGTPTLTMTNYTIS